MPETVINYDVINAEIQQQFKDEQSEELDRGIKKFESPSKLHSSLAESLKKRHAIRDNFKSQLDKVCLADILEYLFCYRAIIEPDKYVVFENTGATFCFDDDEVYESRSVQELRCRELDENMLYELHSAAVFLKELIDQGAYLYESASNKSNPIPVGGQQYKDFLNWNPSVFEGTNYSDISIESVSQYLPSSVQKLFLSRSELNQTKLFYWSSKNETEYQRSVRRTAYRSYIENGFPDFSELIKETNSTVGERRHLVLRGWMAAKGYRAGDRIDGYTIKELWRELESFCPDIFPDNAKHETVRKFTQGICKFS
jgi:hypothetical protein